MLGLYSFGPDCFNYLQSSRIMRYPDIDEKGSSMNINSTYHHIAFFITCGVVANLIPHYISLLAIRSPMLMNSSAAPALIPRPGLGASGAIWSCLAVSGLYDPSTQIVLVFLPMFPFSIGYGLSGMALFDAIGVFRGWQMFGHMQHLTGAAAGVGAYFYGPAAWYWAQWSLRGGKISS
jgi:rhomboid-like protein